LLNYALLARTILVPAPVFRSLCGLAMAFFVTRSLDIFRVETDRRIAEMEQAQLLAADRDRIGRELHDGIIQNIYAVGLGLEDTQHLVTESPGQAKDRIRASMDALNRVIQDIRHYIFDLRSAEQGRELEIMLGGLVRDLRLDTLLEVDLEVVGQRCCWLDDDQVAHVTQIAREALSNVVKHAQASRVTVTLSYHGHTTCLTVADDGKGMDSAVLAGDGLRGQGIANMQVRARMLGGELVLTNTPGQGQRLELSIPCDGVKDMIAEVEDLETWA
jgi:signal transduction histidine kinase